MQVKFRGLPELSRRIWESGEAQEEQKAQVPMAKHQKEKGYMERGSTMDKCICFLSGIHQSIDWLYM